MNECKAHQPTIQPTNNGISTSDFAECDKCNRPHTKSHFGWHSLGTNRRSSNYECVSLKGEGRATFTRAKRNNLSKAHR